MIDADMQTDLFIERKHEEEDKKRILQRVEEVTNLMTLTDKNVFDIIVEAYSIGFGDGHESAKQNWQDWIGEIRDEINEH
jgi:hypothetical protein